MRRWQGLLVLALTAAAWSPSSGLKVALRGSDRQDLKVRREGEQGGRSPSARR
jgi:hypothetical protein